MIAIVSGRRTVTLQPSPGLLVKRTVPLRDSMLLLTTSIPTPRPETSLTFCAVESPGAKMSACSSSSVGTADSASRPMETALRRTRSVSSPRPVVAGFR